MTNNSNVNDICHNISRNLGEFLDNTNIVIENHNDPSKSFSIDLGKIGPWGKKSSSWMDNVKKNKSKQSSKNIITLLCSFISFFSLLIFRSLLSSSLMVL